MNTENMVKELSEQMVKSATKAIIKHLDEGVSIPYQSKFQVPNDFFASVWEKVDKEKVKHHMAENLEKDLADKVSNKLAQELSTDIKQLLSDKEKREDIRAYARNLLKKWEG
jgi:DNA primase large subunit